MKRRAARLAAVLVPLTPVAVLVASALVSACGKDRTLVGAGEDCDLATDCQPGLVCIEERGGRRVCSNDLTRVAGELPPDGGGRGEEEEAGADGEAPPPPEEDGSTPPPPQDSGVVIPPPMDAATD